MPPSNIRQTTARQLSIAPEDVLPVSAKQGTDGTRA